ncbi:MAG TPA: hypothetical protein DCS67_08935 [Clostridiales bacterium UBA8960]|jgi:arsenite-transporting ATPase|nr:hypothetical protein [Clostridiales bacterium UBA8960]
MIKQQNSEKETQFLFFGGKGGVGKSTLAAATALWYAEQGYKTTIISTDPTVSLSALFNQTIHGHHKTTINEVPNLCGLNINPKDAKGLYQERLNSMMGQMTGTFGKDVISTPCMEEMATFDQFVEHLQYPDSDIVVFDTAPTGKTLRELAMPFDWAGFLKNQLTEGKELAKIMEIDDDVFADLERDKKRFDDAMAILKDPQRTNFQLILLPERLPIEETQSAIEGLDLLGIPVQNLIVNQVIPQEVIMENEFLKRRSGMQAGFLEEINKRFQNKQLMMLPQLMQDVSTLEGLRVVGKLMYGGNV